FPKTEQYSGVADQMRRASKGICANIAEGYAKQQRSKPEFKRFLLMAIGSAHEMQVWVDYCVNLKYINDHQGLEWVEKYDEIVRMLQSLYSKI
ncbi:MAG: four helix bundle protein, partial [Bdellovibrionales bacterium]